MDSTSSDQAQDRLDGRLSEALDQCLSRLRAGDTVEACLADYPELAAALRPLLAQSAVLLDQRAAPLPPSAGLAVGRARFLEAAARARTAQSPAAASLDLEDTRLTDAFDAVVARVRAGEPSEVAVGAFPALAPALAPLLATAGQVVAGRVIAPPPPRGLKPGRARFLAVAAERRAAAAVAPVGWWSRLAASLGLHGNSPLRRAALGTMAVLALFLGSSGVVSTAAADALPGDALYGVKRLGEEMRLVLTFSPAARELVEADLSNVRAHELAALMSAGRAAELTWQARYVRLESAPGGGLLGARLVVEPLGTDLSGGQVALVWTATTRAELGPLPVAGGPAAALGLLPPGSRLVLRVATDGDGPPRLVVVTVLAPVQMAKLPAAPPPAAPATSEPETATPETPAATVTATGVPTQPSLTATAPVSPTISPTPTFPATALPPATEEEPEDTLNGVLSHKASDVAWQVADNSQGGRVVDVDVSAVARDRREAAQVGYQVKLVGRWVGADASRFRASRLLSWQAPSCDQQRFNNAQIASLNPGVSLTLVGEAGEFLFVPETVVPEVLAVGMRVDMVYRDCHNGRREILSIGPAETPAAVERGIVLSLDGPWAFTIENENGDPIAVRYGPQVPITGQASAVRVGQVVDVTGRWDTADPNVLIAEAIDIYRDAVTAPAAETPTAPATQTPEPTAALPPARPTAAGAVTR